MSGAGASGERGGDERDEPPAGVGDGPLDFVPDARDLAGRPPGATEGEGPPTPDPAGGADAGDPSAANPAHGSDTGRPDSATAPDGATGAPHQDPVATDPTAPGRSAAADPTAEASARGREEGARPGRRSRPWGPPGRRTGPRLGDERSLAPGNRWLLAVVLLLVLSTVGILASSRNDGSGGAPDGGGLRPGQRVPAFAAPIATGPVMGDVNVATGADQGAAGAVPACAVRRAGVLVSCRLAADGPAALLLTSEGSERCVGAVGQLERLAAGSGVAAAAVVEGGDRGRTARLVRARGWRLPVAHDRDNALASLFGAPLCPFVVLVRADGRVAGTLPGLLDDARLAGALRRLAGAGGAAGG